MFTGSTAAQFLLKVRNPNDRVGAVLFLGCVQPFLAGAKIAEEKPHDVFLWGIYQVKKVLLLVAVTGAMSGCASVMNDTTQGVKIETKTQAGQMLAGADCKLTNDYGTITVKSGDTASVRRSNKDLEITCVHPQNPDAVAHAISRVNASMFGNIIIGGGIGAVVDHARGTAYGYPSWVQLVFGKTLVFDRADEEDGKPLAGSEPKVEPVAETKPSKS